MQPNAINFKRRRPSIDAVVNQVILKVVQRCNLNCTYCYVYNRGDDSWRTRPPTVSDRVIQKLSQRIVEHCKTHSLTSFTVELHGGEPLLLPKRRMQALIETLRFRCGEINLHIVLQTNGTLLDDDWLHLLARNRVSFGISLDGPPILADRMRIMRVDGGGSTQKVLDVVTRLRSSGPLFDEWFGGFLCVVNPGIDGAKLVDWFVSRGYKTFDFLLPDGNRVNFPAGWTGADPYRKFLLSAFDRWYSMGSAAPRIRKFELMMMGILGKRVSLDALGGDLRTLCVVESDGSIGVSDVARICGGQFSRDLLNIFDHPLDEHVSRYRIAEIQENCAQCKECAQLPSCGGGYLPHRFDGNGFDNTSIYCDALYALSARMRQAIHDDLPPAILEACEVVEAM
jgi:uncharacterized protein